MSNKKKSFLNGMGGFIGKISVKNVMNPLLWVLGFVCLFTLSVIAALKNTVMLPYVLAVTAIMIFYVLHKVFSSYDHFKNKDPARLQSEDYLIRKQEIEAIEDNSGGKVINPNVPSISNPNPVVIEHDSGNDENNSDSNQRR